MYIKKIAVIKQLKGGFSADGGALSGIVKAETYAGFLKVEVSLINFAPLSEGKYVFGISDGRETVMFEGGVFEGESLMDVSFGYAFIACFSNGKSSPIASASCGRAACFLPELCRKMTEKEEEKPRKKDGGAAYDDEAITEVNYYELKTDESFKPVREGAEEEEGRSRLYEDEKDTRAGKGEEGGERRAVNADGDYYSRMEEDIEKIFDSYPRCEELEKAIAGSRFVKISYGGYGSFYAFGVAYIEDMPRYICYGVPSDDDKTPPESLKGYASFVACKKGGFGYWVMYQDASTGASIKCG